MNLGMDDITALYITLFSRAPEGDASLYWINSANRLKFSKDDLLNALINADKDNITTTNQNHLGGGYMVI